MYIYNYRIIYIRIVVMYLIEVVKQNPENLGK